LESTHQTSQLHTSRIPGWVNRNLGFRFCAVWITRLRASFGLRLQSVLASLLAEFALFYPQYCSTRAELVIIHTMAPLPTVIRIRVIGVDLPAFLLSKNVFFRFHRNAPGFPRLVWRDLQTADEAAVSLLARFSGEVPRKIKNPASSAGHSHLQNQWLRAKLDKMLPCARRYLTLGSGLLPYRPDRESPESVQRTWQSPNHRQLYRTYSSRQALMQNFF